MHGAPERARRVLAVLPARGSAAAAAVLAALLLSGAAPIPPPDPVGIDRYLASSLAALGFPGAAVAVTRGAEVVYERGFEATDPTARSAWTRASGWRC
jgi:hypothetical protein